MSRTLGTALANIVQRSNPEAYLWIIEINHASLAAPLRFVDNVEAVTFGGNTYNPLPFTLQLPNDQESAIADGTLIIDNVDQTTLAAISALTTAATCNVGLVLASDPSLSLVADGPDGGTGLIEFQILGLKSDLETINCALSFNEPYNKPFPSPSMTPDLFPYLFQAPQQ